MDGRRRGKGRGWGDRKPDSCPFSLQKLPGSSGEGIISMCSVYILLASGLRNHLPTMCVMRATVAMC